MTIKSKPLTQDEIAALIHLGRQVRVLARHPVTIVRIELAFEGAFAASILLGD